jgi:RNA polymerase sigma-70 factor (ECF subfamily)
MLEALESSMEDGEDERSMRPFLDGLAGNRRAFEALARAHRGRILRICSRYTGSPEDAEDLTQEVLLRAYRGLPAFRGDAKVTTWLHRITVNVCLNWVTARKKRTEPFDGELPHPPDPRPSPSEQFSNSERARSVRRAVSELPERQRLTLVLRIYEEMTYKEIAESMDCPVGTAKANFFFALKNLRKRMVRGEDES